MEFEPYGPLAESKKQANREKNNLLINVLLFSLGIIGTYYLLTKENEKHKN